MTKSASTDDNEIDDQSLGADTALDRLNLDQALHDFEIANRRVIDLTQRLTAIHRELVDARSELQFTKIELTNTRAELAQVRSDLVGLQSSNSFKVARVLAHTRAIVRR